MYNDIQEVLIEEKVVQEKIQELASVISKDYAGKDLLLVCILKGSFIFCADLARKMTIPTTMDFMAVSSYRDSATSSGAVMILKDLESNIEGKHILIIEDIVDTGLTLKYLLENLKARQPLSVEVCTLLDKPDRRKVDVSVKYNGFIVPDVFIVGYGLDYQERYRNLPDVCVLKPEIYQ